MILSWCCFNLGWKRVEDGHLHWKYGYIQDRQAPSTCLGYLFLSPGGQRLKLGQRLRERNTVLFQLQQCQTKQTDGALQKKTQHDSGALASSTRDGHWPAVPSPKHPAWPLQEPQVKG